MAESVVYSCRAGVYNYQDGQWVALEAIAAVWFMHHEARGIYRIVASNDNKEFVLNTMISQHVVYEKASEVFLQWKDTSGPVMGLNFANVATLEGFVIEFQKAIDKLSGATSNALAATVEPPSAAPAAAAEKAESQKTSSPSIPEKVAEHVKENIVAAEVSSKTETNGKSTVKGETVRSESGKSKTSSKNKLTKNARKSTKLHSKREKMAPAPPSDEPPPPTVVMAGGPPPPSDTVLPPVAVKSTHSEATSPPPPSDVVPPPVYTYTVNTPPPPTDAVPLPSSVSAKAISSSPPSDGKPERSDSKSNGSMRRSAHNEKLRKSQRFDSPKIQSRKPSGDTTSTSTSEMREALHPDQLMPMRISNGSEDTAGDRKSREVITEQSVEAQEEARRIRLRNNYAKEILSTELTYVSSLQVCLSVWMKPMLDKKLISDDEKRGLFSNLETICDFNQKLLSELSGRLNNWDTKSTKIGDVFVSLAPYLRLYKQYCDNYDSALNILEKSREKNKKLRDFLKNCEQRCSGFALPFYLIMPVQRIPRYNLLLRDLIRQTKPDHPDYNNIQEALKHIGAVADDINKSVLKAEKARAMADLLRRGFHGLDALMAPHRHLLLDGPLFASVNSVECTWVLLFNDIIAFAAPIGKKDTEKKIQKRQIHGHLEFNHTWARLVPEVGDDAVELKTPEQAVLLRTKPQEVKKGREGTKASVVKANWCDELQKAIKNWLLRPLTPAEKEYEINQELIKDDLCETRFMEYKFKDGSKYKGLWTNAKFSGHGKLESPNGSVFEGNFHRGGLQGKAIAQWSDGSHYEGEWQLDFPHGSGVLVAADGTKYDGQWAIGRRKGFGKMTWPNGDIYDGEWTMDRFHGQGTLIRIDEPTGEMSILLSLVDRGSGRMHNEPIEPLWVYKGEFRDGLRHGDGHLKGHGYDYKGKWENNFPHGVGEEVTAAGKYRGTFSHGRREGPGEFTTTDGSALYVGDWKCGVYHGKGKLINYKTGYEYDGEFVDGRKHGSGTEKLGDGRSYQGYYIDDLFEGRGRLTFVDGGQFKGNFHRGMRYGEGTMEYATGDKYVGDWYREMREGIGTFTYADGTEYTGEWKFDKPHGKGRMEYTEDVIYEGLFFEGMRHGNGKLDSPEGVFEGEFKFGMQEGRGTYFNKHDRTLYTGEWKDGRVAGKGTLTIDTDRKDAENKEVIQQIYAEGVQKNPGIKYYAPALSPPVHLDWHPRI